MRVEQQIEYEAKSDAEAIQVARDRLGREAVILSSRPVKLGGVLGLFKRDALWVTAGILVPDQDDLLRESKERMVAFQHLLDVRKAVGGVAEVAQAVCALPADEPMVTTAFSSPAGGPVPTAAVAQAYEANSSPRAVISVKGIETGSQSKDVDEIKRILAGVLERLGGTEDDAASQSTDEYSRMLVNVGVNVEIANYTAMEFRASGQAREFEKWLADRIPVMGLDGYTALGGRRVLFAGPTGVGKTTTIAKIAAIQSLWGNKKVVLMTSDTYRIAAVEQLRTYAKILGIPIEIASDPKETQSAVKKHKDADLILLDTAGRSHYDGTRIDELRALYDAYAPDSVHLVMAANINYRDMLDVIERMGVVPLSALLFTKLDETASYGTIFNVLHDLDLPVSFFTVGQNVPNDIEIAQGDKFVDLLFGNRPSFRKPER
ncbi:MAG: flagellar biosynthesis protein FlhF [Synergistaceae bacterium]|nr:flagellar biosynthesis protein FlhF [Synergistaceae bacterium]